MLSPIRTEYPCGNCEYGSLRLDRATLVRWYGRHFITVPNVPTWKCDVCSWAEYDQAALQQLDAIVGSSNELAQEQARRRRRKRTERPAVQRESRPGEV